jgi:hypothetical protein
MEYYVVKYTGPFGFIKPWTAVRDGETFSQQFLTPSIVEGMEKKLFPELLGKPGIHKVLRHRLSYAGMDMQQERTWAKGGFKASKNKNTFKTNLGILTRGVLLSPFLHLAFRSEEDVNLAAQQHLCLCRNEDIIYPAETFSIQADSWAEIPGFELIFKEALDGFKVGHNRFDEANPMYGELAVFGNPIREY